MQALGLVVVRSPSTVDLDRLQINFATEYANPVHVLLHMTEHTATWIEVLGLESVSCRIVQWRFCQD
eukprot:55703-Eustigmatos_ZCMA.PRE.1